MPKIIDTPVAETVNPYAGDVENLIAQGDGKSITYGVEDGITDEKSVNALKLGFQRAAREKFDRTARSKVETVDGGFEVTFTLRPKQKTRGSDAPAETPDVATADAPEPEPEGDAPKPRRK